MTPAARAYASRASVRIVLCAIVAAYLGFATLWAIRVPPFAPPDEMAHADYMYAFFDAGRFYRVDSRRSANDVLPQTQYLERISGYRRLHYNLLGRVPAGYGTRAFFAAARRGAPPVSNAVRAQGSVMPYVMSVYPSTYYVLVAAIARATFDATRSVVASFFAARACNVALGAATLVFAFATFRRRGLGAVTSLLCVASIAMLPLFCWVSAYVQPDNLVIFLVTFALWAAAGKRRVARYAALAVCGILLVKPLYGAVVWLPVAAYAIAIARDR
ncbi:MAG: hypothetical protein IAI48_11135, partial [Candidatus Eremiobacteraeota bacterium]|nr:hypothetical protein [Candidatus Eremiobacteraeota bacterium]